MKTIFRIAVAIVMSILVTFVCFADEQNFIAELFSDIVTPEDDISVGEIVAVSAKLHGIYNGDSETVENLAKKYDDILGYVEYAREKGIISASDYPASFDFSQKATRGETAEIVACVIEEAGIENLNGNYYFYDISTSHKNYDGIMKLFKAGVFVGDGSLMLYPDRFITYSELNAIMLKTAFPERRIKLSSTPVRAQKQAYLLNYTANMDGTKEGIQSGWELDNRAGILKTSFGNGGVLYDTMKDEKSRIIRHFNLITEDKVDMRIKLVYYSGFDGNVLEFCDANGTPAYRLVNNDSAFCIQKKDGSLEKIYTPSALYTTFTFKIIVDLETGLSHTYINNKFYGTHQLIGNRIKYFAISTSDETRNSTKIGASYAYGNYAVHEDLNFMSEIPVDFRCSGDVSTSGGEFVIGTDAVLTKNFDALNGNVAFCFNTYLKNGSSGAEFSLCSDGQNIVTVGSEDGSFYVNGRKIKGFTDKLWYKMRIEADTITGKAIIKINAKPVATVDFDADFFDMISFRNSGESIKVDDIRVYNLVDYYVPAPVIPAGADDYIIGMNVCSLWVNGEHWGWKCVSPYEDIKPVLGYYDEGLPVVADWENKMMAEHGIDFQAFCWYASQSNKPMKDTRLASQLDEAYLHSKYSDSVKFCLLWEAANGGKPTTVQDFKDYYVTYWMENYFSDPRYMVIDNKLVLGIFGVEKLISEFGTELKEMFDYMREQVKTLGYDGMIISASHTGTNKLAAYGIDAWNAYNWGKTGYVLNNNINNNISRAKSKDVYVIPTVSVGFNSIPWERIRQPLMTVSDFTEAHNWIKNTYLPTYAKEKWQENFIWLSTWNEYGEGTYIMPADKLNGFGYLDALREVYTKGGAHTDVVPTEAEKRTFNHLYPQDIRILRKNGYYSAPASNGLSPVSFDFTVAGNSEKYLTPGNMQDTISVTDRGTVYKTSSENADAILYLSSGMYSGFNANTLGTIEVTASGIPEGYNMQVFFTTDVTTTLSQQNSIKVLSTGEEERVYTFEMWKHPGWAGKITHLRLDPVEKKDVTFAIKNITFVPAYASYDDSERVIDFTKSGMASTYLSKGNMSSYESLSSAGTTFKTHSTNPDAILKIKSALYSGYTADNISKIKVVASGIPVGASMQLFYQTTGAPDLSEKNSIIIPSTTTDETEFVFNVENQNGWSGSIQALRLDPLQQTNVTFTIKSISIIPKPNAPVPELYINNLKVENQILAEISSDGTVYFPFEPGVSFIDYMLYTYHTWDYDKQQLELYRDGKCVKFTVGSDVAIVDGQRYNLPGKLYAKDNIPMLPIGSIADIFGFEYTVKDGKHCLDTPEYRLFIEDDGNNTGKWEFEVYGRSGGWGNANTVVGYGDGTLIIFSDNNDPMIYSSDNLEFDTSKYTKIEVCCKWDANTNGQLNYGFYFITHDDDKWNEAKHVSLNIPASSNDEFKVITIDMSENPNWKGNLRKLRFDPFNAMGIIEVDYIRLLTDED